MIVLSPIEEEKLLSRYSKVAWSLVHRFAGGRSSSVFSKEDLYQECMLTFVKHMRRCETKEELTSISMMNLVNVMTRFVLKNQVLKIDHNRTDQIKEILERAGKKVPLTCMEDAMYRDFEDEIIEKITFDQFLDSDDLRPIERIAMEQTRRGYSNEEIAQETGRSHQVVSYAKKSARKKYADFVA